MPETLSAELSNLEAGDVKPLSQAVRLMGEGRYQEALRSLGDGSGGSGNWFKNYLEGLVRVSTGLAPHESEHFILFTAPDESFLASYALPAMEETSLTLEKTFGHRPKGKIRIEIYPAKDDFSAASTLSPEILERSGAIGICKFHRLMILSPRGLPLGFRWLDALSHEYVHLMVNELSHTQAELWLHEGTARYFETAYRKNPPDFLTPDQKTKLLEALEKGTLIPFERMSPSLVYLKDQEEVSLAFAEVSHAVSILVGRYKTSVYVQFLTTLKNKTFADAFSAVFQISPLEFENEWKVALGQEKWEKTKGTMSDSIVFGAVHEESLIGADVEGRVRLGDQMRMRGQIKAGLMEYERALREEPDNAIVLLKAARAHLALGEEEKAILNLRRAVSKNPNYATPHIELAKRVKPAEAITHLLEANAINPFDPQIHDLLAAAYEKTGDHEKARNEKKVYEALASGR